MVLKKQKSKSKKNMNKLQQKGGFISSMPTGMTNMGSASMIDSMPMDMKNMAPPPRALDMPTGTLAQIGVLPTPMSGGNRKKSSRKSKKNKSKNNKSHKKSKKLTKKTRKH